LTETFFEVLSSAWFPVVFPFLKQWNWRIS